MKSVKVELISTGIAGFIASAKFTGKQIANGAGKLMPEIVSTFVSGFSGWMIRNNGEAEFKSIYARDKIVTNEYVYNRIRVTEDEEIVSTNGKILSAINNGNGTFTVHLDLREGDINGFADGDLMQGYYHSPENSGVIYAVQRLTAQADPNTDDQSMIVTCENGSTPYPHMIIVRVGNNKNEDRQAHIKISSRTNCQYFFDGIASWADMDDPEKVRCVLGKADIGLIPAWAASVVGSIKKWFGLIADGVILRGIFILKSSGKTIEKELEGVGETITEVETRFEVREGQISSKVEETKTYAENASGSATSAAGSANNAAGSASAAAGSAVASEAAKVISVEKASEAKQTAEGFQTTVTEVTKKAVTDAVNGADKVIEEKVGTAVTQSAKQWKVEVMGSDAQGNPNTILAAINADASGIKIKGDKVEIDGTLLAKIIMATGLNINDKFVVAKDGAVKMQGNFSTSFNGKRIEIDPEDNSIIMYNASGYVTGKLGFISYPNSSLADSAKIELYELNMDGGIRVESFYSPGNITMHRYGTPRDPDSTETNTPANSLYVSPFGIDFNINGSAGNYIGNDTVGVTHSFEVDAVWDNGWHKAQLSFTNGLFTGFKYTS